MTDPITARLDEIRARHEAATEGPWVAGEHTYGLPSGGPTHVSVRAEAGEIAALDHSWGGWADGQFLAHSRTDVPQMEAALREVLDTLAGFTPPDPHGAGEGCPDCDMIRVLRKRVASALSVEVAS